MQISSRSGTSKSYRTVAVVAVALLTGCTTSLPYRTLSLTTGTICDDISGQSTGPCQHAAWEHHDGKYPYDLFFVEFDDQGLIHPAQESGSGDAFLQIQTLLDTLHNKFKKKYMEIVVYVHGWKHNARPQDGDVIKFRKLLLSISRIETISDNKDHARRYHRIIGIFVGWRGLSATKEPFKELSFWTRKNAANRVADGSVRRLFNSLRTYQKERNKKWDAKNHSSLTEQGMCHSVLRNKRPPVRMLIIGHSFGGLIVFNSLEPYLLESVEAPDSPDATIRRYGDMVVILNPAFAARRFVPLFRAAATRKYNCYQAPIFVAITSHADSATRVWFPFGRFFGTFFEHFSSSAERFQSRHTIGFVHDFITDRLTCAYGKTSDGLCNPDWVCHKNGEGQCKNLAEKSICPGWENPSSSKSPDKIVANDLKLEMSATRSFFASVQPRPKLGYRPKLGEKWHRVFCGGAELQFVGTQDEPQPDPDIPIWNIKTVSAIIPSHSAIEGNTLISFIRQLYYDSIPYALH